MAEKTIKLVVEVTFDCDYYDPDELADVTSGWLRSALYDRDDLVESSIMISDDPTGTEVGS